MKGHLDCFSYQNAAILWILESHYWYLITETELNFIINLVNNLTDIIPHAVNILKNVSKCIKKHKTCIYFTYRFQLPGIKIK